VVRGDYLILVEGDRVPADGVLVWGLNCKIDESLLTGESIAVEKESVDETSEMGKIGKSLINVTEEDTLFKKETTKIVKTVFIIALVLCATVIGIYGLTQKDWISGILSGLTLAMAMLPEEFPVVLTVFLALGAWRLSKKQVLTRKVAAIETLGAATVFCVDKTGTLTKNQMSLEILFAHNTFNDVSKNEKDELPEIMHELSLPFLPPKKGPSFWRTNCL